MNNPIENKKASVKKSKNLSIMMVLIEVNPDLKTSLNRTNLYASPSLKGIIRFTPLVLNCSKKILFKLAFTSPEIIYSRKERMQWGNTIKTNAKDDFPIEIIRGHFSNIQALDIQKINNQYNKYDS